MCRHFQENKFVYIVLKHCSEGLSLKRDFLGENFPFIWEKQLKVIDRGISEIPVLQLMGKDTKYQGGLCVGKIYDTAKVDNTDLFACCCFSRFEALIKTI